MKKLLFIVALGFCTLTACREQAKNTTTTDTTAALPAVSAAAGAAATPPATALDWNGKYTIYLSYGKVGGKNAGLQLDISITPDSSIATGQGFELYFKDQLKASAVGNKIILRHVRTLAGDTKGKTMDPEFTLMHDDGKFYVQSKWIRSANVLEKPTENGYLMEKVE